MKGILQKDEWLDDKPIIIITGDIVNDGREKQFDTAFGYIKQLSDAGFTVRLIPGNHDYGLLGNVALDSCYEKFEEKFSQYLPTPFPIIEPFGGHLFIGLNSMKAESGFWDGLLADGELGTDQINGISNQLNDLGARPAEQKLIVYLHHHPFYYPDDGPVSRAGELTHRLKDAKKFMEMISKKADILLFGHEHRHLNFSKSQLSQDYEINCILSCGKSTINRTEFPVRPDGTADIPKFEFERKHLEKREEREERKMIEEQDFWKKIREDFTTGLLGYLIEIKDDGIDVNTLNFP